MEWTGGTQQWISLKILKELNPVQVAEYAVGRDISKEPAFSSWVGTLCALQEGCHCVSSEIACVRTTHKYGIELPNPGKDTIEHEGSLIKRRGILFT